MRISLFFFALAAGCGSSLSNDLFEDDATFLDALPSSDRQALGSPDDAAAKDEPPGEPGLRHLTRSVSENGNAFIRGLLVHVDNVRRLPPSERGDDSRTWGPFEGDDGVWFMAQIERTGEAGTYTWEFSLATAEGGPWTEFFTGEHRAGTSVAKGDGAFQFDFATVSAATGETGEGLLTVDYDLRHERELVVDVADFREADDDAPQSFTYWFWTDGADGDFEFLQTTDLVDEGSEPEDLEVRSRWVLGGGGRSDAVATGPDIDEMGIEEVTVSECWDSTGRLVYQDADPGDPIPREGEESECVFEERAEVEHL